MGILPEVRAEDKEAAMKTDPKPVIRLDVRTGEAVRFPSVKRAAESTLVSRPSIARSCNGLMKGHVLGVYDFRWEEA